MISFRHADLLDEAVKTRVYDAFFYIWFTTTMPGVGGMENVYRDNSGRLSARLEIYFPDQLTDREKDHGAAEKIKQKIEIAIGQPINQRIASNPNEDISQFYERLREKFEPKLKQISESVDFDSLISHGMVFRLKMTTL